MPGRTAACGDRFAMHQNKTEEINLPLPEYKSYFRVIKYQIKLYYIKWEPLGLSRTAVATVLSLVSSRPRVKHDSFIFKNVLFTSE